MTTTDDELRCIMALADLGLMPQPGETALDAVLRIIAAADPLLRPYRYEQVDGMRGAFQAWATATGAAVTAGTLNTFQAGYTAMAAIGVSRGKAAAIAAAQAGSGYFSEKP